MVTRHHSSTPEIIATLELLADSVSLGHRGLTAAAAAAASSSVMTLSWPLSSSLIGISHLVHDCNCRCQASVHYLDYMPVCSLIIWLLFMTSLLC
jgi:hypothetical protein